MDLRRLDNPLLRSRLALAGFNNRDQTQGADDKVLTTIEVAGLDLHGAELVVLSACKTGLGKVESGEGVYGLKRALVLAGSRTQVVSHWKVVDDATQALMNAYCGRLYKGEDRIEALRQVQLDMAEGHLRRNRANLASRGVKGASANQDAKADWRPPCYWASFVLSGRDGPIQLKPTIESSAFRKQLLSDSPPIYTVGMQQTVSFIGVIILMGLPSLSAAQHGTTPSPDLSSMQLNSLKKADALVASAESMEEAGDLAGALAGYSKAVDIREGILGRQHIGLVDALSGVASVLYDQGQYAQGQSLYLRVLAIEESALGKNHGNIAATLNNLALCYEALESHSEALTAYQRALRIDEKNLGPDHIDLVTTLDNLAKFYQSRGQLADKLAVLKRSLKIQQRHLGGSHIDVARSLFSLAKTYVAFGQLANAEPLLERTLDIEETALGSEHVDLAETLDELGYLYWQLGRHDVAFDTLNRALEIRRQAHGEDHIKIGESLNNFGLLYMSVNEFSEAEHWFNRSLKIYEKHPDADDDDIAVITSNLASSLDAQGKLKEALPLHRRSLKLDRKRFPAGHPRIATGLNNLAMTYSTLGQFDKAIEIYPRVLGALEESYGPNHPRLGMAHYNVATVYGAKRQFNKTIQHLERAFDIERIYLGENVQNQVAETTRKFVSQFDYPRRFSLTLAIQNADTPALHRVAARTVTEGKGLAGEAERQQAALARKQMLYLEQIQRTQSELSALSFSPSPSADAISALQARLSELKTRQAKLGQRSEADQKMGLAAMRQQLTHKQALIDFAIYEPYDVTNTDLEQNTPEHMAAVVIRRQAPPRVVGLGPVSTIDALVGQFRDDLIERRDAVNARAKALHSVLIDPLKKSLEGASELIISPDGALNLVPFSALTNQQGRRLTSQYTLRYLTTARQLVALTEPSLPPRRKAVLLADAAFGRRAEKDMAVAKRGLGDTLPKSMAPLPGTRLEANALASLLRGQGHTLYMGDDASEARLRALHGPLILHVATHGFFLPDQDGARPMLRSGLALAGFDARLDRPHDDDGLLTAMDISGLDLYGTELVVLSACETGLGEVAQGDGVFGLKRALALAGSRTQVLSLWKVDDNATAALMTAFYQRLLKGESRANALRRVQLDMAEGRLTPTSGQTAQRGITVAGLKSQINQDWRHPYYWASFTLSGADGPVDFKSSR